MKCSFKKCRRKAKTIINIADETYGYCDLHFIEIRLNFAKKLRLKSLEIGKNWGGLKNSEIAENIVKFLKRKTGQPILIESIAKNHKVDIDRLYRILNEMKTEKVIKIGYGYPQKVPRKYVYLRDEKYELT